MAGSENSGTNRKLILEGFVIVVSILAAFGLDTWWDSIQESQVPVDFEVAGVFASRFQIVDHAIDEFEPLYEEVSRILELIQGSRSQ